MGVCSSVVYTMCMVPSLAVYLFQALITEGFEKVIKLKSKDELGVNRTKELDWCEKCSKSRKISKQEAASLIGAFGDKQS